MSIRILIFVWVFFSILSCKRRTDNNSFVIEKDTNGDTISAVNYINDTTPHGVAKYYKHGHISEEAHYKNGVKNGLNRSYYEDGNILSEIYWRYGRKYGPAFYYYPNGRIETFNSYDFDGNNRYLVKYDTNGNKITDDGVVLGQFLIEGSFDSIPINKEFIANISFSNPPNTTVRIFSYEPMGDYQKVELAIKEHTAIYRKIFSENGKHTIISVGELKNQQGITIKRDSIITDIIVK